MGMYILVALGVAFLYLLRYFPIGTWMHSIFAGSPVSPMSLVAMKLRGVNAGFIVDEYIKAQSSDLHVSIGDLEGLYLANGDVTAVLNASISAKKSQIPLTFEQASAISLAGRNVEEAVRMSVDPKVIQTPPVTAMAKDGIQVRVTCRVTVKANIERLIGGAGEQTILARIGEGVVSTIGSSDSHKMVLENPSIISRTVNSKHLDRGTAFEIISLDIMDVDVGRNIGAHLQTDQAQADTQIAQAKASGRKAEAVANEEEMKAELWKNKAKVVEAESRVPESLAQALRQGSWKGVGVR